MVEDEDSLEGVEADVAKRQKPHSDEVEEIEAVLVTFFVDSVLRGGVIEISVMLKLLNGVYLPLFADATMVITIAPFILFQMAL